MNAELIAIGQVRKPFGLKGHCYVDGFGTVLAGLSPPRKVLIGPGESQTSAVALIEIKASPRGYVCRFEGIESRDSAETLRGGFLFLDKNELPPLKGNEYYHYELEGMTVVTSGTRKPIGIVTEVQNFPTMNALNVRKEDGSTVLIALGKGIIEKIDRDNTCIIISESALEQII
ncbi:MAG: ribosome maturation factor RimM [Chitinivibrionales bacterium]